MLYLSSACMESSVSSLVASHWAHFWEENVWRARKADKSSPAKALSCYIILYYIMLRYVMLCYVTLCYVMLCYMLCYVMLCYMLCYVMLCYVMFYFVTKVKQTTLNINHTALIFTMLLPVEMNTCSISSHLSLTHDRSLPAQPISIRKPQSRKKAHIPLRTS